MKTEAYKLYNTLLYSLLNISAKCHQNYPGTLSWRWCTAAVGGI